MSAATGQKWVHTAAAVRQHDQCRDSDGMPDFPDPSTRPSGGSGVVLSDLGLGANCLIFQATQKPRQGILPGSK
jgi:hypothetical protein